MAGRGVQAVLSIVYLALATRTLGLVEFGRFSLIVAVGQSISALVGFQTWQFVVRYGTPALIAQDHAALARVIGLSTVLDFAAAAVGSVVSLGMIVLLGPWLSLPRELYAPAFGFCFAMLIAVRSTPTGVLRLEQRFRDAALADAMLPSVRAAGALLAVLMMPSVAGFLWAWGAAEVSTALVTWRAALQGRRMTLAPTALKRLARAQPSLWRFLLLTNLTSTLTMTSKQVTLLSVGAFGGPAAAGMFRVAAQLAQALAKATQTFSRAAFAELVLAIAKGSDHRLLLQLTALAGLAAAAMLGIAVLFAEPLLRLIATDQFADAYWPIVILVAAAALDLFGFAFEPAMTARGHAGAAFRLRMLSTAVLALLLLVLLPRLGIVGGAWATFGGSLAAVLLTGWGVFRRPSGEPSHRAAPSLP